MKTNVQAIPETATGFNRLGATPLPKTDRRERRRRLLQRLARYVEVWIGETDAKKGMGLLLTFVLPIVGLSLWGEWGALACCGYVLLIGVFWFGGFRRNQVEDEAAKTLSEFVKRWKELKPARIKAAACATTRFGVVRFFNDYLDLEEGSPEACAPPVADEAKDVIRFFEDLCQVEYKWKYAGEEFHDTLKLPLLAYCRSFQDVIQNTAQGKPVRCGEVSRVFNKYSDPRRPDGPSSNAVDSYLEGETKC
jgi:hypothetical protein